jgi:hypothetical protein
LILLDGDRRVIGWNAWIEKASGISDAPPPGAIDWTSCFGRIRAGHGIPRHWSWRPAWSHTTSSRHPAVAHPGLPAGPQHFGPPERQTAQLRCLLQVPTSPS